MGEKQQQDGALDVTPRYQRVKAYILKKVSSGEWPTDARIPSEHDLVRLLGVSRVTVNRALRELASDGLLDRVQGVGTFVADAKPQSTLIEIRNIADEIAARGHVHTTDLHLLRRTPADAEMAAAFGLPAGAELFHCILVHREDGLAVQLEDRYVNPVIGPQFLNQDFSRITPYEYLMRCAPLGRVEQILEAVLPDDETQRRLEIAAHEPCLMLHRRTWSWEIVATRSWLTYPGSRYRFGGSFDGSPAKRTELAAADA